MLAIMINLLEKTIFKLGSPTRYLFLKLTNGNQHSANMLVLLLSNFSYALTTPFNSFYMEKNITGDLRGIADQMGVSLSFLLTIIKLFAGTTKLLMVFFSGYIVYKSKYYTTPIIISQLMFCINSICIDVFAFSNLTGFWRQLSFCLTTVALSFGEAVRDVGRVHLIISTCDYLYKNKNKDYRSSMSASFLFLRRSIYQLSSSIGSLSILYLVKNNLTFLTSKDFLYSVFAPIQIFFLLLTISFSPSLNPAVVKNVEPTIKKYYDKMCSYIKDNGFVNSIKTASLNALVYAKNYIGGWGSTANIYIFSVLNCILIHIFCSVKKNLLLYITLPSNTGTIYQNIKLTGQICTFIATSITSYLLSERVITGGFILNLGAFMVSIYVGLLYGILQNFIEIPTGETGQTIITILYTLWLISIAFINSTMSMVISDYWSNKETDRDFFSVIRYISLFIGSAIVQVLFSTENITIGYIVLGITSFIMLKGFTFNFLYLNEYTKEK